MANSGIFNPSVAPDSGIIRLPLDADGGLDLREIMPGTIVEVETRNNTYTVIPQDSGEVLISGHPEYCPEPTVTTGLGSACATGLVREGYLVPGMRLSFQSAGRRVNTSRIQKVARPS